MEKFQIRTFRDSVLQNVETLEAPDLLDVIDRASPPVPDVRTEIWSRMGRVGMIGPAPTQVGGGRRANEEAEIAAEMKVRLRLVRG